MAAQRDHAQDGPLVTFTEAARARLLEILDQHKLRGRGAMRIAIKERSHSQFNYAMGLEEEENPQPQAGDLVLEEGEFRVFVDADSARDLRGSSVDYVAQLTGGGFQIHNPNPHPLWENPTAAGIQQLIDTQVNPAVASHGGYVELLDIKENTVYLRMGGGCQGCGMVDVTLRQGIERLIKQDFPQIEGVIDTTDHAGGTNPYYQPAKDAAGASPLAPGATPHYQPSKG